MHNSKLLKLLKSLSKRELNRFNDFIHSPYFNKNTDIIALLEYIQTFAPSFRDKKLQKSRVVSHFQGTINFNEKKLASWMNGLLKLLEKFLSTEKFDEDIWQAQLNLIEKYQEMGLVKKAKKNIEKALTKINSIPKQNPELKRYQYLLLKKSYELSDKNKREFNEQLQRSSDALDQLYIIQKLRYGIDILNLHNIMNLEYDMGFIDDIIQLVEHNPLHEKPVIATYLQTYKMLKNPQEDQYFKIVKNLLARNAEYFDKEELNDFYTWVLNFCIQRINKFNENRFKLEYLEINKFLIDQGLLLEKGLLSPWRYTNLINLGLQTKQEDWAIAFLKQYNKLLPKDYQDQMYRYNSGMIAYYQEDYDKAQAAIINLESKDVLLNLFSRSLLIKIYFETDQTELLLYFLEANRIYILRNKLIDPILKIQMKNFVNYTRKLAKIDFTNKEKLPALKSSIPPATKIMHHDWLLKQFDLKIRSLL
jgi:hypothetical protein